MQPDGFIDVAIGTQSAGQGHETSFGQLIAEWFGVGLDQVRLIPGDTDRLSVGAGLRLNLTDYLSGYVELDHEFMSNERNAWTERWNRIVAGG